MESIKKCSIAGYSFRMTEQAYQRMNSYIRSLENAYSQNDAKNEIIADIEARIAELILSVVETVDEVVKLPLVENIIKKMGEAEQIGEQTSENDVHLDAGIQRRLYRDMSQGKIGGVCAGLACYFKTDVAIIRVAIFIPLLLSIILAKIPHMEFAGNLFINIWWTLILVYIILWFSIPRARTARQKMEQNGEDITSRKIAERQPISQNDMIENKTASTIGNIILAILKIILIIMALPLFCVVIAIVAFIVAILLAIPLEIGNLSSIATTDNLSALIITSLLVLIPIGIVLSVFLRLIFSSKPNRKAIFWGIALWVALLIADIIILLYTNSFTNGQDEVTRILKKEPMEQIDSLEYEKLIREPDAKSIDI
ncbi:MAG: PspC domain-containing protein [Alistipes sp.]|nr:PspC domain-containing protein [Candidatus Alistipes equi]